MEPGTRSLVNWLKSLNIISDSVSRQFLESPETFYKELCHGVILPKLAMYIDKSVTYGMVNNISANDGKRASTLDRKENIQLFLSACAKLGIKKSIDIDDLDPRNEKTLNNLFTMLQKLSKKVESDYGPLKILPKHQNNHGQYSEIVLGGNIYNSIDYNESEIDEVYERYISARTSSNTVSDTLVGKIDELLQNEENYQKRFLGIMERVMNHLSPFSQVKKLLNNLKIESLISLHKRFQDELKTNKENTLSGARPNIPDVFINFKVEFLAYSSTIVRCNNLEKTLNLIVIDPSVNTEVKEIENLLETGKSDGFSPTDFNKLFYMPFKHLINYKNLLIEILKQAKKDQNTGNVPGNQTFLIGSIMDALKAMHEVLRFINKYMSDSENREMIRRLQRRISNMSLPGSTSLDVSYGEFHFEKFVNFKMISEVNFERRYIICFQSMIFVCEQIKDKKKTQSAEYRYRQAITVSQSMIVSAVETQQKNEVHLRVLSLNKDGINVENESFVISTTSSESEELKEELEKLSVRKYAQPKDHLQHKFEEFISVFEFTDDTNFKSPPVCGICKMFLFGQLLTGYKCSTCNKVFHERCFIEGKCPEDMLKIDGISEDSSEPPSSQTTFLLSELMGCEEDKTKLSGKEHGTFFIYKCQPNSGEYEEYRIVMVSYDDKKNILLKKLPIKSKMLHDKKEFYLASGSSLNYFPDLVSLVSSYKKRFELDIPLFRKSREDPSGGNISVIEDMVDTIQQSSGIEMQSTQTTSIIEPITGAKSYVRQSVLFPKDMTEGRRPSSIPRRSYGHQAEYEIEDVSIFRKFESVGHRLEGLPIGTFLIQETENEARPYVIFVRSLSPKTGDVKIKQISVLAVEEKSQTLLKMDGNNYTFKDVREMVHRFHSKFKKPFNVVPHKNLPYYTSKTDHKLAEELLRSEGYSYNYVLRENNYGDLRLTAMQGDKIIHIAIDQKPGKFKMGRFESDTVDSLVKKYAKEYYGGD